MHQWYDVRDALCSHLLGLRGAEVYIRYRYLYLYLGAIAISVLPLLADYVSHKSRGTSAAFLVFMSSLGALTSAYINFTLLNNIDDEKKIYMQYGLISSIILILGVGYTLICLKPGNSYYIRSGTNQRKGFK
jgi:hypothetical protein